MNRPSHSAPAVFLVLMPCGCPHCSALQAMMGPTIKFVLIPADELQDGSLHMHHDKAELVGEMNLN